MNNTLKDLFITYGILILNTKKPPEKVVLILVIYY